VIKGGYYLKARCFQDAEISYAPPHIREIWDWIIKEAQHETKMVYGVELQRGQLFTSYQEIRDGLSWKIGYRTERYSKWDCESAMKYFTKHDMITTRKTTRGMVITVIKYDIYQDPLNYENHTGTTTETTREPPQRHTINKNGKKNKNKEEEKKEYKPLVFLSHDEFEKLKAKFGAARADDYIDQLSTKLGSKFIKYDSHYLTILNYERRGYFTEPRIAGEIGWAKS
jgi:hypothetical protein